MTGNSPRFPQDLQPSAETACRFPQWTECQASGLLLVTVPSLQWTCRPLRSSVTLILFCVFPFPSPDNLLTAPGWHLLCHLEPNRCMYLSSYKEYDCSQNFSQLLTIWIKKRGYGNKIWIILSLCFSNRNQNNIKLCEYIPSLSLYYWRLLDASYKHS